MVYSSIEGHSRPILIQFFMRLKQQQKTTNKNSTNTKQTQNLPENAVEVVKPNFGPQNMFDCAFFEHK